MRPEVYFESEGGPMILIDMFEIYILEGSSYPQPPWVQPFSLFEYISELEDRSGLLN